MSRKPSLIRRAWGLQDDGGLVVVPDEFRVLADACGLLPAERLTVIALLRQWNPRKTVVPIVCMPLDEICWWTGLSKGQQSRVLKDLLTRWRPALITVVDQGAKGSPRSYDLAGLVARTQRIATNALRQDRDALRVRNQRAAPAQQKRSVDATHSRPEAAQTSDVETETRPLALLTEAELGAITNTKDARYQQAVVERMRRRTLGNGKARTG